MNFLMIGEEAMLKVDLPSCQTYLNRHYTLFSLPTVDKRQASRKKSSSVGPLYGRSNCNGKLFTLQL